ncbi:MAG: hypothetical protein ACJAVI_002158 [Candidatus Azotimanducaceae bacterium]|jgi:hypothetical protein
MIAIVLVATAFAYPGQARSVSAKQSISKNHQRFAKVIHGYLSRDISA